MNKNDKLSHLYYVHRKSGYEGWAMNATALFEDGPRLSRAIAAGIEKTGLKKGEFIVKATTEWKDGNAARECNEHALEIANQLVVNPKENLKLWTDDDLILLIEELTAQIENIEKALRGWPVFQTTEFVSKDSSEYGEWAAEQDDE